MKKLPLRAIFASVTPCGVLLSLLGGAVLSFGLYHIHAVADITEGGVLGLALLFEHLFSLSPALTGFLLNALAYFFGWRRLGRPFLVYSAFSAGGFSLFYFIFEQSPPLLPAIAEHPLLASLLGALFVGIGCGLSVRVGGAPSGDDAVAMALSSLLSVRISWVYLCSDLIVLALSLLYIPLSKILYSLLTVLLSGQIIDLFARLGKKKEKNTK